MSDERMGRALVIVGGWAHPAASTGPPTAAALEACGLRAEVVDEMDDAARRIERGDIDLLVMHTCRFQMLDARYNVEQRAAHAYVTSPAVRAAIAGHLDAGRPMLALHTAPICFDDWDRWPSLVGATWSWDRSNHPPPGPFTVEPSPTHPLTAGLAPFKIVDELYRFVEPAPAAEVLATAIDDAGSVHPIAWLHHTGQARVVYNALGHDHRSLENEHHRAVLTRLIGWLLADQQYRVTVARQSANASSAAQISCRRAGSS
jgi:uncharacterized protein